MQAFSGHLRALLKSNRRLALTCLLLASGAALLLFGSFSAKPTQTPPAEDAQADADAYAEKIEARLTSLLSSMEGVGRVQVMVTVDSGSERAYLSNRNSGESADPSGRSSADRKEDYVIVRSGSAEQGILVKVSEPVIRGVAVVCSGGDDPAVRANVIDAVTALLHLNSARVSVAKMDDSVDETE